MKCKNIAVKDAERLYSMRLSSSTLHQLISKILFLNESEKKNVTNENNEITQTNRNYHSGGEQQLISIARLLINPPKLVQPIQMNCSISFKFTNI
jgi:ABC-type phosphate transport system ATPase subunit